MDQRLNKEKLDDPNVLKEDDPPMLRFEKGTIEDRVVTEDTGIMGYIDTDFVFVRAYGDNKNEVPYIAKTTAKIPDVETVLVEKLVPIDVERVENGQVTKTQRHEKREVPEERTTWREETIYPWFEQLDERLRNGRISENYVLHCKRAYQIWEEKGESPVIGIPLTEWAGITEAHRKRLLDMGLNSVELVAQMTEDAIAEFGMNGRDIKGRAQKYLQTNQGTEAAIAAVRAESNQQISALEKKIEELMAEKEKPKKPRSKKEAEASPS